MRHDKSSPDPQERQAPVTLSTLRIAAQRLSDTRKKPRLKTRDLVGLLLSHGARAWRNSLPPVNVSLKVTMPDGTRAVRYAYRLTSDVN